MNKLLGDLIWTYGSMVVMATSGLTINVVIGVHLGAESLGIFNQTMAVFVVVSQLSAFGFHLAVFKHAAEEPDNPERMASIGRAGLSLAALSGIGAAIVLSLSADVIGTLLKSDATAIAIRYAATALPLLNLNKVLLAVLNARGDMRNYAIGQTLRYGSMALFVIGVALGGYDIQAASFCFVFAETASLIFLLAVCGPHLRKTAHAALPWIREIGAFGAKGLWSGFAAELNLRIDILVIGIFLSDREAGIYSLVSALFEGLLNVIYAVRLNINPSLVRIIRTEDAPALRRLAVRLSAWIYPCAIVILIFTALLYVPVVNVVFAASGFAEGYAPLLILVFTLTLVAGVLPLDQLLLQSASVGTYSTILMLSCMLNAGLNLLLVPHFGMVGAATATSLCLLLSCAALLGLFLLRHPWVAIGSAVRELD